jgi:hypothetical protein
MVKLLPNWLLLAMLIKKASVLKLLFATDKLKGYVFALKKFLVDCFT